MAGEGFNKDVAEQPGQQFWYWPRPAQQFQGQRSNLGAIGEALETGINDVHTSVRMNLEQEVDKGVRGIQDEYRRQLASVDPVTASDKDIEAVTTGGGDTRTLISDPSKDPAGSMPPEESKRVEGDLLRYNNARHKMSETEYWNRVNTYLQQERYLYNNAWNEHIDSIAHRVLGVNPANQEIRSRIADLNQAMASRQAKTDRLLGMVVQEFGADPAFKKDLDLLQSGTATAQQRAEIEDRVWDAKSLDYNEKRARFKAFQDEQDTKSADAKAQDAIVQYGEGRVKTYLKTMESGGKTLDDLHTEYMTHPGKYSNQDYQNLAQQYSMLADVVRREVVQHATEIDPTTKKTLADLRHEGMTQVQKDADALVKPYLDIAEHLTNKEFGPAAATANAVKNTTARVSQAIQNDPDLGFKATVYQTLAKELGPVQAAAWMQVMLPGGKVTPELQNFANLVSAAIATQPHLDPPAPGEGPDPLSGKPITLKGVNAAARRAGINDAEVNNHLVNVIATIGDPKTKVPMEVRTKFAVAAFSDANRDLIKDYAKDNINPVTGRKAKGQTAFFQTLWGDRMAEGMRKVAESSPEGYQMYQNWQLQGMENFENLFQSHVDNLNHLVKDHGYHVRFDSTTNHFTLDTNNLPPEAKIAWATAGYARPGSNQTALTHTMIQIKSNFDDLNAGIDRAAKILETQNSKDLLPDAIMTTLVKHMDLDPTQIQGLPPIMLDIVQKSKAAAEEKEKTKAKVSKEFGE